MIVVIDTSVLISAAFCDRTPEEMILFVTGQDAFHYQIDLSTYDVLLRNTGSPP